YYEILGVNKNASPEKIRSAYRNLAMKYHPDHFGSDSRPFRDLKEAYNTLIDPEKRRNYNESLDKKTKQTHIPVNQSHRDNGPSTPPQRQRRNQPAMDELTEDVGSPFANGLDDLYTLFNSLFNHTTDLLSDSNKIANHFDIQITLSEDEARNGTQLDLDLPLERKCEYCRGIGRRGLSFCTYCSGSGRFQETAPLTLNIPANTEDGKSESLSDIIAGYGRIKLNLYFKIQ
ncbi:MAG: DnaJ domain-containing protein, partial [Caldithrix sp.]|nr:DnaJ domain-containing protein [Caldithrix sp.]